MQEEVTGKSVAVIIKGAKISEKVLEKALGKLLEAQKNKQPKVHRGKQTLKQLAGQNAGLANIEITDQNIKSFTHVAKKYHVDFALKKDTTAEQPRYLVFFKSRDADAITAAFQEFASRKMSHKEKATVRGPCNSQRVCKTPRGRRTSESRLSFSKTFQHDLQTETQPRRPKSHTGRHGTRGDRHDHKRVRAYP